MQRHATESGAGDGELTPEQARALAALVGGATITAAGEAAGRDRTTVHRWLREDHGFQAVYNTARADLRREVEAQLDHIVQDAVEAVRGAVRSGDVRAALAVLKGTGVLSGAAPTIGAEDPAELAEEIEADEQERAAARMWRRMGTV